MLSMLKQSLLLLADLAVAGVQAEMRTVVDDAGREVRIPANPERVISQNDNRLTLPLLELEVPLVGSAGRLDANGDPYLRAVPELLGVDFDTSGLAFIGTYNDLDYEVIAGLNPDLIFTMIEEQVEPLSRIAPTVMVDPNRHALKDGFKLMADMTGRQAQFESLMQRYERKLLLARSHFPDEALTANVMFSWPSGDAVYVYQELGALTVAMADLGIEPTDFVKNLENRTTQLSPELMSELDADFLINFYGSTPDAGPHAIYAGLDSFLPGWCQTLHACREGQVLMFPYASFGYAFSALELNLDLLTTHIAGRRFERIQDDS